MTIEIEQVAIIVLRFVALWGWRKTLRGWWTRLWMREKKRIFRRWLPNHQKIVRIDTQVSNSCV